MLSDADYQTVTAAMSAFAFGMAIGLWIGSRKWWRMG